MFRQIIFLQIFWRKKGGNVLYYEANFPPKKKLAMKVELSDMVNFPRVAGY